MKRSALKSWKNGEGVFNEEISAIKPRKNGEGDFNEKINAM